MSLIEILAIIPSLLFLIIIISYKQKRNKMYNYLPKLEKARKVFSKNGSGYYFIVTLDNKVIRCFSIGYIKGLDQPIMQTIGDEKVYDFDDLDKFMSDTDRLVFIRFSHHKAADFIKFKRTMV